MSAESLQAVVIGAGWAGEGHTRALRHCGVDVHTICARQMDVVRAVADRLDVPHASTDWRATLESTKPDIVALATPASLRRDVIEAAAALGAHVYCDKPLGVDGGEAKDLLDLVDAAGVKHAYAATGAYHPDFAWAAELLADGAVGEVREIESIIRFPVFGASIAPWSWFDSLSGGGGYLNTGGPHAFAIMEQLATGKMSRVMGAAVFDRRLAPVLPSIHDFRHLWLADVTEEALEGVEWRECDAETAASIIAGITPADGETPTITANLSVSGRVAAAWPSIGWRIYGDRGTLAGDGMFSLTRLRRWTTPDGEPEFMPTPQRLIDAVPVIEGDDDAYTFGKWAALARDFVADIRGEPHAPYLTFRDGWRYQVAIDAIRAGRGWTSLSV